MTVMTGSWFRFLSSYTMAYGVEIELTGRGGVSQRFTLRENDVSYLCKGVDAHVTGGATPMTTIAFPLFGGLVQVNDEEWAEFLDALTAVASSGGWH
jgi:hypothetical protein